MSASPPIREFNAVTMAYGRGAGRIEALRGVTFRIGVGAFCVVLGPSGAGKSTLLKLVLAMQRPQYGTIVVAERDIHRLRRASIPFVRRNVGAVFQDFKLLPDATPQENVEMALQVQGLPVSQVRARARHALRQVELEPSVRRPARSLSGGEQQRVAIARALVTKPAILLADEPTGNLDPRLSREILDLLREVNAEGTTVLVATHDPMVRQHAAVSHELHLQSGSLVFDSEAEAAASLVEAVA